MPEEHTHLLDPVHPAENIARDAYAAYWLACSGLSPKFLQDAVEKSFRELADRLGFEVVKRLPAASSNAEAA